MVARFYLARVYFCNSLQYFIFFCSPLLNSTLTLSLEYLQVWGVLKILSFVLTVCPEGLRCEISHTEIQFTRKADAPKKQNAFLPHTNEN